MEVSRGCSDDCVIFQIRYRERIKIVNNLNCERTSGCQTHREKLTSKDGDILWKIGCKKKKKKKKKKNNNNNNNNCSCGFFRLPNVRKTTPEVENLSLERRRK